MATNPDGTNADIYNPDGTLKPGKKPVVDASNPRTAPGSGANVTIHAPGGRPGEDISPAERSVSDAHSGVRTTTSSVDQGILGGRHAVENYSVDVQKDPNLDINKNALASRIAGVDARVAQTMTPAQAAAAQSDASQLNMGQANQSRGLAMDARGQQSNFANVLRQSAMGNGPSAAQAQLQAGTDASLSSALALAHSQRGGNQAVAMKQALTQNGQTMQQASNQSAQLRAQEQQQAQGTFSQALGNMRAQDLGAQSQDLGGATTNAQLTQQTALANAANAQATNLANAGFRQDASKTNLTSGVDQQKQKDALIQSYMAQGMVLDQASQQAEIQQKQFNASLGAQQEAAKLGVAASGAQGNAQAAGATAAMLGTVLAAAASDERVKTNIKDGGKKIETFLDALGAHSYRYKQPEKALRGEGEFVSPMAQEIEKTELGKSMVKTGPDGTKVVDYGKGFGTMLAGMAHLFSKVKRLEAAHA